MALSHLRYFLFFNLLLFLALCTRATETAYIHGELLVQTKPGSSITEVLKDLEYVNGKQTEVYVKKKISDPMHVWLLGFDEQKVDEVQFLYAARNNRSVSIAQFNHIIKKRATVPDDTNFGQQWQYINTGQSGGTPGADIDADLAWDITTGGLTPLGDTIVVCVVDDGLDPTHTDFGDNVWMNHEEIPNNNIDDDGNGYTDDYLGWNADDGDDDITGGTFGGGHGTPVAGIIGAQGDNNHGVTGVNWNVKLMIVVGGGNEAQAVAAYSYPLVMRKRYNQSGGTQGAFVVATNSSWGIDQGQPADAPLWCAMYDSLGAAGILSAGATANANFNIDVVGDLPTGCPSDYLITVTNTNDDDVKLTQAGYGITTIDLGAPGQGTYTVADGNSYAGFGGTSGATPHVAGTIGLLYSAPCFSFSVLAQANPGGAALAVKNYIMDGTDPNNSLDGITVSGGRLNMYGALNQLINNCALGGCIAPYTLEASSVGLDTAVVAWDAAPGSNSFVLEYRPVGAGSWSSIDSASSPMVLQNLMPCTDYEFHVLARCDNDTSLFSETLAFKTDGCCDPPEALSAGVSGSNGGSASWDEVAGALSYNLRIKPVNSGIWDTINSQDEVLDIYDLLSCTEYEVQVQTVCDTGYSDFTESITFQTADCDCDQSDYCPSMGESVTDEWIAYVKLGSIDNSTLQNGGYADFTNLSTDLQIDSNYTITLAPGYSSTSYQERFRVWIDWNRNGVFDDPMERAYSSGSVSDTVMGNISIPSTASEGTTGMRVSMMYQGFAEVCATGGDFEYGEVEDYCVNLVLKDTSTTPDGIEDLAWKNSVMVYPNPFNEQTTVAFTNAGNETFNLNLIDASGRLLRKLSTNQSQIIINREGLRVGLYIFELSSENGKIYRGKLLVK